MTELLQYGVPIVCAGIAAWSVRQEQTNRRLKRKLRAALEECRRFYELEETYCDQLSSLTWHKTALAAKRWVRALQRSRAIETPSVTAQEIARELGRI